MNGPATSQPAAPLTHTYLDLDASGYPVGLDNRVVAARGTGSLVVTLLHVPPLNGTPVKTGDLASRVRMDGGFGMIGGATDASVTFMVTVP